MIQIFHCTEKKPPSKLALNYVSDMIEAIGFVDLDMESVLYQNSEELFSLFDLFNLLTKKEK